MAASGFHVNPFPGIRSYDIHEDEIFFGREHQVNELVDRLSTTRFLAIVGSSGCGKSSLIRAGLIPALIRKKTSLFEGEWDLFVLKPGSDPIGNLARAFSDKHHPLLQAETILRAGQDGIARVLREKGDPKLTLLVIDQFEEIFRYKNPQVVSHSAHDAYAFVDLLMTAIHDPDARVYVVFTMRTDFLDDCTEYRGLSEAINLGYYLVPRMTDQERQLVITGPVRYKQAEITSELVTRLMEDVGDNPDQLPILQHALMRTWDYWSLNRIGDQPIGLEHYEAIGTMKEALSIHLEEIYEELREPRLRFIAERLFKALTDLGPDNRGIRRPALLADLCTLTETGEEEVIRVIDAFREPGRAFLMPSNTVRLTAESTIDISHESIMRVWKRLKGWVEEQNRSAQLYLRLAKSAELYQMGMSGLWVNPELQLALQWKEQNKPNATWAMRYDPSFDRAMSFLEHSRKQHDLETERKEKQQRRNLKRARVFAIVLGAASLISILFLVISLNLRFKAEASRKEAMEKQALAETERRKTEEQRKEAILQKRISEQQQEVAEQQKVITEQQRQYAVRQQGIAQEQTRIAREERSRADGARSEAVEARDEAELQREEAVSQKLIADQERDKAERSEEHTRRLRLLSVARSLAIQSAQLSGTVQDDLPALLALQAYRFNQENGGSSYDADIFQALAVNGPPAITLRAHHDGVRALAATEKGDRLYSCGDDGQVLAWNLNQPGNPATFSLPRQSHEQFRSLAMLRNGTRLAAGTFAGTIYLFNPAQTDALPAILKAGNAVIHDLAVFPNADRFVSAAADGRLLLWMASGESYESRKIDSLPGIIRAAAINPAGTLLSCAVDPGEIRIYDASGGLPQLLTSLPAGTAVLSLAFSPGGEYLAAGLDDGTMLLFRPDEPGQPPVPFIGSHQTGMLALAFSPGGHLLYSGGYDRLLTCQPVDAPEEKAALAGKTEGWIYCILASESGNRVICGGADKTIMIFPAGSDDLAAYLTGRTTRNLTPGEWDKYIGTDIPYEPTVPGLP